LEITYGNRNYIDGMFAEFTQEEVDIDDITDIKEMAEEDGSEIEDYLTFGYDAGIAEILLDSSNSLRIFAVESGNRKQLYDEYFKESECVSITKDGSQDLFKRKAGKAYIEIGKGFGGTAWEGYFQIAGNFNPILL